MYVVMHGDDELTGVEVNGEFKPDNGVYTARGYYALFRDIEEVEKFGAGVGHREATDEELSGGVLIFDVEWDENDRREVRVV